MSPSSARRTSTKPTRCAILVRISDDKAEDEAGVDRQEKDCRKKATELGWGVAEVYRENDTSAYTRRKVTQPDGTYKMRVYRPELARLINDLESGVVDGLIAYDLDRVARDPRDLEDLIDVVELKQVPTTAVTGEVDLASDNGIFMARMMVNVANKFSRDTARRVKRKQMEMASTGQPRGGGRRGYGYTSDGRSIVPEEAKAVRQMAKWILEGKSLNAVAVLLNKNGVPTVYGGRWMARSVHSAVTKPQVAGLVTYQGELLGAGKWKPILDRDTWERVRLALGERGSGGENELKRWLSGMLACSRCGEMLSGVPTKAGGKYVCRTEKGGCGRISIMEVRMHKYVERMLLTYLGRRDVIESLTAMTSQKNTEKLRKDMRDDQRQLKDLAAAWAKKEITMPEYMAARREIVQRVEDAEKMLTASLPLAVRRITEGDVKEIWEDLTPPQKREVARTVFPNGFTILPHLKSGLRGFDTDRVVIHDWDDEAALSGPQLEGVLHERPPELRGPGHARRQPVTGAAGTADRRDSRSQRGRAAATDAGGARRR